MTEPRKRSRIAYVVYANNVTSVGVEGMCVMMDVTFLTCLPRSTPKNECALHDDAILVILRAGRISDAVSIALHYRISGYTPGNSSIQTFRRTRVTKLGSFFVHGRCPIRRQCFVSTHNW